MLTLIEKRQPCDFLLVFVCHAQPQQQGYDGDVNVSAAGLQCWPWGYAGLVLGSVGKTASVRMGSPPRPWTALEGA